MREVRNSLQGELSVVIVVMRVVYVDHCGGKRGKLSAIEITTFNTIEAARIYFCKDDLGLIVV